jgi:hypothetical protein
LLCLEGELGEKKIEVILVEDRHSVLRALRRLLESSGFEVWSFALPNSGRGATVRGQAPNFKDAVICDNASLSRSSKLKSGVLHKTALGKNGRWSSRHLSQHIGPWQSEWVLTPSAPSVNSLTPSVTLRPR